MRIIQSFWRTSLILGMTGGILWVATLPIWIIRNPAQIEIEGNQLLSEETVLSLLPIQYPQRLLDIEPEKIEVKLISEAPIGDVAVIRRLFPPGLVIRIQERHPVAIARPAALATDAAVPAQQTEPNPNNSVGLIDDRGFWIPLSNFTTLNQNLELPQLQVIGNRDQYRTHWAKFYQVIRTSPIQVTQIDWREAANVILTTDQGVIHTGSYINADRLKTQLNTLDQMRNVYEQIDPNEIAYIDLRDPSAPILQMVNAPVVEP